MLECCTQTLAGRNEPPRGTSLPRAATTSLGGAPFSRVMSNGYSLHFPFLLLYLRLRQLQAPALASRLVGISRCQEGFSISVPPSPRFSLFIPRGFFIVFPPHHPTYILQIDECLPIVCVRVVPCAPPLSEAEYPSQTPDWTPRTRKWYKHDQLENLPTWGLIILNDARRRGASGHLTHPHSSTALSKPVGHKPSTAGIDRIH